MTRHRERRPLSRPTQAGSPGVWTVVKLGPGWSRGSPSGLYHQGQVGELGAGQVFLFIMAFAGIHSPVFRLAACGRAGQGRVMLENGRHRFPC